MDQALRDHAKHGDYDLITDGDAFAGLLTRQLQEISHDQHLRVVYTPYKSPSQEQGPSPEQKARQRKQLERSNCGFVEVKVLPGNIGYLKFNLFADPEVCGPTAVSAMNFLSHIDAIIFDLRENGGGEPAMVALISTYLFDKPTHLNDLYDRKADTTTQYWTLPYVPGDRLAEVPAFVLTSAETFSGAEEFSYNLKNLKRATLVGETTGGGAHPVRMQHIDDHFILQVPYERAINPISKTNWEGTGVVPDVPVKASAALDTAEQLARTQIRSK
jgi:C-terminal processing protease CtpA/Prc